MLTPLLTDRLELIPLTQEQLSWFLEDPDRFNQELGRTSRKILTRALRKAIEIKLKKMQLIDVMDQAWITCWLMKVREDGTGIGLLGYKGVPDYRGQVEIGYGIDPGHQNQGYTTEAATVIIQWAFQDPRCLRVVAPGTRRDNPASNRVLEKLGMTIYQQSPEFMSWKLDKSDFLGRI